MFINSLFSKLAKLFTSGQAQSALDKVAAFVPTALPYINIAAQIVTGITPTTLDDQALALVKSKYPRLFDSSLKTGDEVKLFALGVASELMTNRYPTLSTSIARAAVQLAYVGKTA
jgi:hypothetical protein